MGGGGVTREKLKEGNLGQGKMQNVPLPPRSLLLFLFCHPPFHLIPIPIHHRHQRDWLRLQKHYIRRSTFYIWMTYEVKAFNSNATREPVVRRSNEQQEQTKKNRARDTRGSSEYRCKSKSFYSAYKRNNFRRKSFLQTNLVDNRFYINVQDFFFSAKKIKVYITTFFILFRSVV